MSILLRRLFPGAIDDGRDVAHDLGEVEVLGRVDAGDAAALIEGGVARVYTPKDFDLTQVMRDITAVVDSTWKEAA